MVGVLTMNSLFKSICVVAAAGVLSSCSDSMEGVWLGECCNDTIGGSKSGLKMSIKQEGDKLEGVLVLQDDLYGSGKLVGYVNGKDVTIRSEGDTETFVNITWTGKMKDGEYKGTYRVEPTPSAALLGKEIQKGSFILLKQ